MRRLITILFLALLSCHHWPASWQESKPWKSIYRVRIDCEKSSAWGTGYSSGGYLYTAAHVIDGCPVGIISSTDYDGKAEFIARDKQSDKDAYRLLGRSDRVQFHTVWDYVPHVGEEVCYWGGQTDEFLRKCGTIFRVNDTHFWTTIPGYPGNSGGPVFNRDGHVIGMLVMAAWGPAREKQSIILRTSAYRDIR